ncbi:MAG: Nramp family divalent metal transporter [Catenulispora sp.]
MSRRGADRAERDTGAGPAPEVPTARGSVGADAGTPETPAPHRSRLARAWRTLGPGLVAGASDDDPSGVATYAQAGARFGFGLLWTALFTLPLMAAVQETCDRIALATGGSLGDAVRERFGPRARLVVGVLTAALIGTNTIGIAADLVAVGSGASLLHLGPVWVWALVAGAVATALPLFGGFGAAQTLFKFLSLLLLAYPLVLFTVAVPWGSALRHFFLPGVPTSREELSLLVAVLGTTISPYLFFWQSADRAEEMRHEQADGRPVPLRRRRPRRAAGKQRTSRIDVFTGVLLTNTVMFSVMVSTAGATGSATGHGAAAITTAGQAAEALRPVAGNGATILFALGFIGSGMLAVPVLAAAGSAGLTGLADRPWGLRRRVREAPMFYTLIAVATLGGTALTALPVDPMRLLVFAAIVNGVACAPFLVVVMLIARDAGLVGRYRNGALAGVLGWAAAVLMAGAAVAMLVIVATGGGGVGS